MTLTQDDSNGVAKFESLLTRQSWQFLGFIAGPPTKAASMA